MPKNDDFANVIFILTDDLGIWAVGCYGNDEIHTPNIDRLADNGLKFENFFCTSPVCSPSRASFLTGQIPSQHGVHDFIRDGNIPPSESERESDREAYPAVPYLKGNKAYTDVMSENGYECAITGKWHLGDSLNPQKSFDHWFVHQRGAGPYYDAPMVRDCKPVNEPGYVSDVITDQALEYMEEMSEPFYLSVHYTAPHSPWMKDGKAKKQHPEEIVEMYDDCPFRSCPQESRHPWAITYDREVTKRAASAYLTDNCLGNREALKGYFAAVTAMDCQVGRIIDWLEKNNMREDTLIVFTGDNGFNCGHHGFWGKGNGTFPLNMYEYSIKVPFIVSHPGSIPKGKEAEAMMSAYDFLPTVLDYLDLPIPKDKKLPGKSLNSVFLGKSDNGRENVFIFDEYGSVRMIRSENWKYVHRYPYGPHELYNLSEDSMERNNLMENESYKDKVTELRKRLSKWFFEYVDPGMDGLKHGITGKGQYRCVDVDKSGDDCFYEKWGWEEDESQLPEWLS